MTTIDSPAGLLVLGLGGNAPDSEAKLLGAFDELCSCYGPSWVAPLYRTAPISPIPQPDYLNTVAVMPLFKEVTPDPLQLLEQAKALEYRAGRREGVRWGPRPLDVDLLLVGDLTLTSPQLTLPHAHMRRRRFVLAPLCDLMPDLRLPPDHAVARDLLAALGDEQVIEKIGWTHDHGARETGAFQDLRDETDLCHETLCRKTRPMKRSPL